MPLDLKNAPSTFLRAMDLVLSTFKWQIVLFNIDDIVMFLRFDSEHLFRPQSDLGILSEVGVSLKLKKVIVLGR